MLIKCEKESINEAIIHRRCIYSGQKMLFELGPTLVFSSRGGWVTCGKIKQIHYRHDVEIFPFANKLVRSSVVPFPAELATGFLSHSFFPLPISLSLFPFLLIL